MKFDDVISELGEFGPHQKFLYLITCLVAIPTAMQTLNGNFIQATPKHRCAIPGLPNDTFSSQGPWHDALVNVSIPWDNGNKVYDQCKVRREPRGLDNDTETCSHWVYSKDPFTSTFVTDVNLVCDDKPLITYATMILMSGMLAGAIVLGPLADVIGRKKVMAFSAVGQLAASIGIAFSNSYALYVTLRFLDSFFGNGMYIAAFVIGMELVGPSKRSVAGIGIQMFWCLGLFIETGIAYGLRDWSHFQLAISAPAVLTLFAFIFLLPESPRWLLQRGRTQEAAEIIQKVARKNGVTLSEKVRTLQDIQMEGEGEKIWHMFTSRVLLFRSLIIFYNWLAASMMYYGLSLNVGGLTGDIYLNFFLSAVVEMASYFSCVFLLHVTGRKVLHCGSMLLGGLACTTTLFPVLYGASGTAWITMTLSLVGKFGASAGFAIIYIYSAELFPTAMRNSAMGICSLTARVGGILAPYIGDLKNVVPGHLGIALPLVIFGAVCASAGLLVLFLPETSNRILPDTLEDAKQFGKSDKSTKNSYQLREIGAASDTKLENPRFRMEEKY